MLSCSQLNFLEIRNAGGAMSKKLIFFHFRETYSSSRVQLIGRFAEFAQTNVTNGKIINRGKMPISVASKV